MSIFDILSKPIATVGGSKSILPQVKTSTPSVVLPKEAPASTTLPQAKPSVVLPQQSSNPLLALISKPISQVAAPVAAVSPLPVKKPAMPTATTSTTTAPIAPEKSIFDILRKPVNEVVYADNTPESQKDTSLFGDNKPLGIVKNTITGLPAGALRVAKKTFVDPIEVRGPFAKDTEKETLPYGGLFVGVPTEIASRLLELIPKVATKAYVNYSQTGKTLGGDTETGVKLPFDPSRLGIQKNALGNAVDTGGDYVNQPWVKEYLNNPGSFKNLSKATVGAALTVGQDIIDAIGAGEIVSSIAKAISAGVKVPDNELVTAWNGLGKPATVEEAKTNATTILRQISNETKGGSINAASGSAANETQKAVLTYMKAIESQGIPQFPSAFSVGAKRAADALNVPVDDIWATLKGKVNVQPYLGVRGLLSDGKTDPKVASIAEDHLSEARDVMQNLPKQELDNLGGAKALVANTKKNIVDGLKAEGFADDAARIQALDTSAVNSIDDLERTLGVAKGTPISTALKPELGKPTTVAIEKIKPAEYYPTLKKDLPLLDDEFNAIAKDNPGLVQLVKDGKAPPIPVRELPNGLFEPDADGATRLIIARHLGIKDVPVVLTTDVTGKTAAEAANAIAKAQPVTPTIVAPATNKEVIDATIASKALGASTVESKAAAAVAEAPKPAIELPGAKNIIPRSEIPTFAKRASGGSVSTETTQTPVNTETIKETTILTQPQGVKAPERTLADLYKELGDRKPTPAQMEIQAEAIASASDLSKNLITKAEFDTKMADLTTRLEATLADQRILPKAGSQPAKSPLVPPRSRDPYEANLTVEEARSAINSLFTPEEVNIFFDKTLLQDTKNLGYYSPSGIMPSSGLRRNAVIRLYETGGKVSDRVVYHEAFHAYFNEFVTKAERDAIIKAVKNNPLTAARGLYSKEAYPTAEARAEEWLADDFARYVRGPEKYKGMFRDLWERLLNKIRDLIRRASKADQVYRDILNKKRPAKAEPSGLPKRKASGDIQDGQNPRPSPEEAAAAKAASIPEVSKPQAPISPKSEKSLTSPTQYDEKAEKAISKMSKDVKESAGPVKRVVDAMREYKTNIQEYVQDADLRVKQLVEKKGVSIDDASDPYLKMTLYPGRVGAKVDESRVVAEEIFADMKKVATEGKTELEKIREDVNDYLIARHAPERNAALGDGAAGITTAEAKARVAEIESSPMGAKIKEIADKAQTFNNRTLDLLKESGVITDELYQTLRAKYKNHVPLQRVSETDQELGPVLSGRGYDVRSTGIKRAKGSSKEVADVIGNIITNYEQAVIRAEKNIVDQATLAFVRKNREILGDTMKVVQLPVMPVAKVTHTGQVFPEVMQKVEELVNKYGGTHTRKLKTGQAFGSYRPATKEITTRFGTSKDTLIHEFGHMLDYKFNLRDNGFFDGAVSKELRTIADLRNANQAYARKAEEKLAEFVSVYFNDRGNAMELASITTKKFEAFMADKPELKDLSKAMKSRERAEESIEEVVFARQQFTNDPSILSLKEHGKNVYIKIEDPQLAIALKGIGREKLGVLMNAVASFTRLYSGLATRFNPEFAFPNKLRDLQETAVYLASQKGMGFKGAAKAVAKDPASIKDVIAGLRGKDTPGAKLYREMQQQGGTTGGMGLSTRKQVQLDIDKLAKLADSKTKRIANNLIEYIDGWNTIFEDSTRLSVYKQALEQGLSKERAAALAKEASINFNRMGKGGPVINALWMFSNASIQGSTKMIRSFKNPKVLGATVLAVGSAVAAVSEWNDQVDPEWRDKVTKYDRLNGLTVALPSEDGKFKYITIPVSWGMKPIKVMADYAYDSVDGKQKFDVKDFTDNTVTAMIEAYNPVGGTDLVSALVPTALDVPVEINRNRSWSGVKIKPDMDQNAPADIRYFDSLKDTASGRAAISISEILKDKADISVSPADMKYAYDQYIGGAGRTVSKVGNLIQGIAADKPLPLDEYPFLSRFYRERSSEEIGNASGGRPEELKSLLADQSRARFKVKQSAEELDAELQKMSPADANARVQQIKKENPELFAKLRDITQARKLGLTGTEKLMMQLGVTNGERAKYIDEQIMKLPNRELRNAYYADLRKKKIISDEVAAQIRKLRANQ